MCFENSIYKTTHQTLSFGAAHSYITQEDVVKGGVLTDDKKLKKLGALYIFVSATATSVWECSFCIDPC